jgi:hypothetical protein
MRLNMTAFALSMILPACALAQGTGSGTGSSAAKPSAKSEQAAKSEQGTKKTTDKGCKTDGKVMVMGQVVTHNTCAQDFADRAGH